MNFKVIYWESLEDKKNGKHKIYRKCIGNVADAIKLARYIVSNNFANSSEVKDCSLSKEISIFSYEGEW